MSAELLVVLLLVLALYVVPARNRFVRQQHLLDEAEAQVEVELRRRRDLVPALVEAVRDHEAHESSLLREALQAASAAQTAADGPRPHEVGQAEARLTRALAALPAARTGPVEQLQRQLAETEDRIAAARRFRAASLRALQVRLDSFPSALVGRAMGVERPEPDLPTDRERAELELPPERDSYL
jgi:LemA protein